MMTGAFCALQRAQMALGPLRQQANVGLGLPGVGLPIRRPYDPSYAVLDLLA